MFFAYFKAILIWLSFPTIAALVVRGFVSQYGDSSFAAICGILTFIIVLVVMSIINTVFSFFGSRTSETTYVDHSTKGPTHNHYTSNIYDQRSVHFHNDESKTDKLDK